MEDRGTAWSETVLTKTVLAVVASTILSALLLLIFPELYLIILFFIIIIFQNPVNYSYIVIPAVYTLGGIIVFMSGAILNISLTKKLSFLYKIVSFALYILLSAGIAVSLLGYIQNQLSHPFI